MNDPSFHHSTKEWRDAPCAPLGHTRTTEGSPLPSVRESLQNRSSRQGGAFHFPFLEEAPHTQGGIAEFSKLLHKINWCGVRHHVHHFATGERSPLTRKVHLAFFK
ncbi:hypothetical protein Y032_0036g3247 [Ancylostoma ceylanicum]|nr:hypothetical protein Y032_0036g3247 [Ancylostoma ceylanicum]